MKGYLLIILSIIYSQNQSVLTFKSNYSPETKLSFQKWNEFYKARGNHIRILDNSLSNWFYSMGPYNDTWGTDIYLIKPFLRSKSLSYYPFKNTVLSFRTKNSKHVFEKKVPVSINIFGLNIKKLKIDYQNWQFYGSE